MKKLHGFWWVVCLFVIPLFYSCDDDEGYSIGDFTPPLWATVRTTGNAFYLDCDVWGTLWPVNTDLGWYEAVDGQRVIASFNPLSDNYGEYDHAVKILDMQNVLTKPLEVLTEANEEEFGNDAMRVLKDGTGISGGYFNVWFQQNLPTDGVRHRISLVRPEKEEDLLGDDCYLHLQLRYNDYDKLSGVYSPYPSPVSFNLNELNIPEQAKGIKIHLNSEKNGEVELTYDFKLQQSLSVPSDGWGKRTSVALAIE